MHRDYIDDIIATKDTEETELQEEITEPEVIPQEPTVRNQFNNIHFFSIAEEDKEYYLNVIHSIPDEYIQKLNKIEIYGKKIFSDDGNYFCDYNYYWVRTNCEKGNFKSTFIHELTHHNLWTREGKLGYDFQKKIHTEDFYEMEQEIKNSLK